MERSRGQVGACPNVSGMRRTARLPLPLLLITLVLAGCTQPDPMPTPPSTPSASPVFASDEEALAAAEEAYGKYLETVDAILADGGSNAERLKPLVTPALFEHEREGFATYASKGWRGIGTRTFTLALQQYDSTGITAYSCDDLTNTDVVDTSGASIVSDTRENEYAFEVSFELNDRSLVVASKELWDGGGVC